jgi:hypothetical protein
MAGGPHRLIHRFLFEWIDERQTLKDQTRLASLR